MISAMIFSAGMGSRLKELGKTTPKALVEINSKPAIFYILKRIERAEITHIVINLKHLGEKVKDYVESLNLNLKIDYSFENELLETGGGLKYASHFFKDSENILLHNVDLYTSISIKELLAFQKDKKNDVTLGIQNRDSSRKLLFDKELKLKGWKNLKENKFLFREDSKFDFEFAFSGVHIINFKVLDRVKDYKEDIFSIKDFYLDKDNLDLLISGMDVSDSCWFDLGTVEKIEKANKSAF